MKQKLILMATLLTVIASSIFFTGCNSDSDNSRRILYSFTSYVSSGANSSLFVYTIGTDGPEITLTANAALPAENFTPGSRVVLAYYTANDSLPTASQAIELLGAVPALTLTPREVNIADSANWDANSMYVTYMQRNGGYIDMEAAIQAQSVTANNVALMVDRSTLDDEMPQLYLANYIPQSPYLPSSTLYASFDIRSIWNRPNCRGVIINVNNSNNQYSRTFTFKKQ